MTPNNAGKLRTTSATTHLCVGAYADRAFRRHMLLDVYADRSRWAAPSYGFDLVQVAVHARRAMWLDTVEFAFLVAIGAMSLRISAINFVVTIMLIITWHVLASFSRL